MTLLEQANTLAQTGQLRQACQIYEQQLAQDPLDAVAWNNYAHVLDDLGDQIAALICLEHALAVRPNYVQAICNKGVVLNNARAWEEALACFDECLKLKPDFAIAYSNRGNSLRSLHRYEEALDSYCQASTLDPGLVSAHWNESTCRLHMGDYGLGWKKHEWRWQTDLLKNQTGNTPHTTWREGNPIQNKKITIWPEGGFGDAFQFTRFALTLRDAGAEVAVAAPTMLLKLYQQSFRNFEVIPMQDGMPMPDCDYHCSIMSLPFVCGVDSLEQIPVPIPYLFADEQEQATWANKLNACIAPNKKRIGLAWAGNPATGSDLERSLTLDAFSPLGSIDFANRLQFISLQKGVSAQQMHRLNTNTETSLQLLDLTADLNDWADTAALVANLDLIITCDTGVAHLAAAMGKPTWILNRYNGCWRWLADRTDSPWYPTVRLFRQPKFGDWETVIQEVASALATQLQADQLTAS